MDDYKIYIADIEKNRFERSVERLNQFVYGDQRPGKEIWGYTAARDAEEARQRLGEKYGDRLLGVHEATKDELRSMGEEKVQRYLERDATERDARDRADRDRDERERRDRVDRERQDRVDRQRQDRLEADRQRAEQQRKAEQRAEHREAREVAEEHARAEQQERDERAEREPREPGWAVQAHQQAKSNDAAQRDADRFENADHDRALEVAMDESGMHRRDRTHDVAMAEQRRIQTYGSREQPRDEEPAHEQQNAGRDDRDDGPGGVPMHPEPTQPQGGPSAAKGHDEEGPIARAERLAQQEREAREREGVATMERGR